MDETSEANGSSQATGPKDFSRKREAKTFVIDGETFEAAAAIPGEAFAEFTTRYAILGEDSTWAESYEALRSALELVLLPDSYKRLHARFKDLTHPVDLDQMADIVLWLLDEYGMRPTQPPSDSSDGPASPESGTSSTESTPPEESTSQVSLPIAS